MASTWGTSWGTSWATSWDRGFVPPTPDVTPTIVPAGAPAKRRRKVMIGNRLYEVDSLRDVEFLLKRIVREQEPPEAPKPRTKVVAKVKAKLDPIKEPASIEVPMADWSALYQQLARQDQAYAQLLEKVLRKQEEDDIEVILMLLH